MREILSTVEAKDNGKRILDYLKSPMALSVTLIKRVKFGGVFINGENVHMRATVHTGDSVLVKLPEEKSEGIRSIDIPLDVLYEDEWILAVNKPTGMPTHPSRGNSLPTLAEAVMAYFKGDFVFRAINRLDRDTSGIVIIAKDAVSAGRLSAEMKRGGYVKKYLAFRSRGSNTSGCTGDRISDIQYSWHAGHVCLLPPNVIPFKFFQRLRSVIKFVCKIAHFVPLFLWI